MEHTEGKENTYYTTFHINWKILVAARELEWNREKETEALEENMCALHSCNSCDHVWTVFYKTSTSHTGELFARLNDSCDWAEGHIALKSSDQH